MDGQRFTFTQGHRGPFYKRVFALHLIFTLNIAGFDCNQRCHNLCCGGHRQTLIRIPLKVNRSGKAIHYNCAFRIHRACRNHQEQRQQHSAYDLFHLSPPFRIKPL